MGRCDELETWDDFQYVGPAWRDEVANVRLHAATHERLVDRVQKDQPRPLPAAPVNTILLAPPLACFVPATCPVRAYSPLPGRQAWGQRQRPLTNRINPGQAKRL